MILLRTLALSLIFWPAVAGAADPTGRIVTSLDRDWRFIQQEIDGGEDVAANDASWQRVDVPHDWAIAGPFDEANPAGGDGGFLPTGVAWYRKHFTLPDNRRGKSVFIEFDGVMANSDVWINGVHLGHRPNGYVSFGYEISEHLKYGDDESNVLAVRADTSEQIASRWYTGSGIYRQVRLVEVEPLHVEPWGVGISTPHIADDSASVAASLTLRNQHDSEQPFVLQSRIVDSDGKEVATSETSHQIAGDSVDTFRVELEVPTPRRWDIDDPHLYHLESTVLTGGTMVDRVTTSFGIRQSEFKPDTGYWLNGRNLKIKGVCLHHDGGAVGAAVPLGVWEYRLERLRELGVNAIRTAHNPVAPEFLDLCDRRGFLVMNEFFDCWRVGKRRHDYHKHFDEWAHRDMRDTILRDRNHPSVILYSVGNEIRDTPRPEHAKRILSGLIEVCHETDPTRPVTQALFRPNTSGDYDNGLADMLDVIGTNYRDSELLQAWKDDPTRKIIGTEQGHDRNIWLAMRDNPHHAGQFLWVGIDYLGESRRWPITTFNTGLLDRAGWTYPRGYERQSWWSDQPMVAIFRREAPTEETPTDPGYEVVDWQRRQVLFPDWTPRDLASREENVEVVSNCEEVELLLNGQSLGTKSLPKNAKPRNWNVKFEPGELVAVGRNGGEEVTRHTLRTAGEPQRLRLSSHRQQLGRDWNDVAMVVVEIVDADGTLVPRADHRISFQVSDGGEIIAVDNGSIVSHEPFQATERRAFQGRCLAIVRAATDSGAIAVTATAEGLHPATATIEIVPR